MWFVNDEVVLLSSNEDGILYLSGDGFVSIFQCDINIHITYFFSKQYLFQQTFLQLQIQQLCYLWLMEVNSQLDHDF